MSFRAVVSGFMGSVVSFRAALCLAVVSRWVAVWVAFHIGPICSGLSSAAHFAVPSQTGRGSELPVLESVIGPVMIHDTTIVARFGGALPKLIAESPVLALSLHAALVAEAEADWRPVD